MAISPKNFQALGETANLFRVHSARTLASTKSSNLSYGRYKDVLNANKIPKKILTDKEGLYEENISLKIYINRLEDDILKLKTKLQVQKKFLRNSEKNSNQENQLFHLRKIIKDLESKLGDKNEENDKLKKNLKITKSHELETELKVYQEQCSKLNYYLQEVTSKQRTTISESERDREIADREKDIIRLKKEQAELQREIYNLKDQAGNLRTYTRSSNGKTRKGSAVKNAEASICGKCQVLETDLRLKSKQNNELINDFKQLEENIRKNNEEVEKKLGEYNEILEDKTETINMLNKQLVDTKNLVKNVSILPLAFENPTFQHKKYINPPKLFKRINKIIKSKYLFLPVFLSFLDKSNTGYVYEDDLINCTKFKGKPLKASDITEAISLMQVKSSRIPIQILESWFEKYEYTEKTSQNPAFTKITPETSTKSTQFENIEKKIELSDVSFLFDQIKLLMLAKSIPRIKTLQIIFNEKFSVDSKISPQVLETSLVNYFTEINTHESIVNFCLFLARYENSSSSGTTNFEVTFKEASKKFMKYLPEWKVIDRFKAHCEVAVLLKHNKPEILGKCRKSNKSADGLLNLDNFTKIVQQFGYIPEESLTHLYLLSFERKKILGKVNFLEVFEGFEEIESRLQGIRRRHKGTFIQIREKLRGSLMSLDSLIGYEAEFFIPVVQFVGSIEAIGIKVSKEFVSDITEDKPHCDLSLFKACITENLNDSYESEFNFEFN